MLRFISFQSRVRIGYFGFTNGFGYTLRGEGENDVVGNVVAVGSSSLLLLRLWFRLGSTLLSRRRPLLGSLLEERFLWKISLRSSKGSGTAACVGVDWGSSGRFLRRGGLLFLMLEPTSSPPDRSRLDDRRLGGSDRDLSGPGDTVAARSRGHSPSSDDDDDEIYPASSGVSRRDPLGFREEDRARGCLEQLARDLDLALDLDLARDLDRVRAFVRAREEDRAWDLDRAREEDRILDLDRTREEEARAEEEVSVREDVSDAAILEERLDLFLDLGFEDGHRMISSRMPGLSPDIFEGFLHLILGLEDEDREEDSSGRPALSVCFRLRATSICSGVFLDRLVRYFVV